MTGQSPERSEVPLSGVRVLNTRAREDSAPLRKALEALGAAVYDLPAIATRPLTESLEVQAALERLGAYDWIAFTSRNAVRALFDAMAELGLSGRVAACVAAVGPSTAAALHARNVEVTCVAAETTARGLGAAMREHGIHGARVLLPLGDLAGPDLREVLEEAGALVDSVVVYETVRPTDIDEACLGRLRRGEIDVIAFSSPSAVRNLAEMLGTGAVPVLRRTRAACIGPSTAAALGELGLQPAAVASEQSVDGLVAAVVVAAGS